MGIGYGLGADFEPASLLAVLPGLDLGTGDGRSLTGVHDQSFGHRGGVVLSFDDGQIAHEDAGVTQPSAEVRVESDDDTVKARLEVLGGGDFFRPRLVVRCGGQGVAEPPGRLVLEQRFDLVLLQMGGIPPSLLQSTHEIIRNDADMGLGQIAVSEDDVGPCFRPDALRVHLSFFGLDALDQCFRQLAAGALREAALSLQGDFPRLRPIPLVVEYLRELVTSQGG